MKTINIKLTKKQADDLMPEKLTDEQWDYVATKINKYIMDYLTDEINYYLVEIQEDKQD